MFSERRKNDLLQKVFSGVNADKAPDWGKFDGL